VGDDHAQIAAAHQAGWIAFSLVVISFSCVARNPPRAVAADTHPRRSSFFCRVWRAACAEVYCDAAFAHTTTRGLVAAPLGHRDFAAWRLIRDAFAVRERIGDPRAVPGFRCSFRPDMPPSLTSGSSIIVSVQNTDVDIGLRHGPKSSALPIIPQSVSRGARFSRLRWFATATACQVAGPLYGSDQSCRAPPHDGQDPLGDRHVGHHQPRGGISMKRRELTTLQVSCWRPATASETKAYRR
jgi:hypothetical protein